MDDPMLVCGFERLGDLLRDGRRVGEGHRAISADRFGAASASPDGKQMADLVNVSGINEGRIVVADADGSQPRAIASRKLPLR